MREATPRYGNVYYPGFPIGRTYTPPPRYAVDGPAESPPNPRWVVRRILLNQAYDILKARHPDRSTNDLYLDVAERYGCEWDTVREARVYVRQRKARRRSGDRPIELAMCKLPRVFLDRPSYVILHDNDATRG